MNRLNNNIKLVIWDMDETFWSGTISEEEIIVNEQNIELIKNLVDRGIMNSISSKNDFDVVKNKLTELGIWDYFVFPKINWNPKGAQIKQIIEECKLRPINVLFIDDNPHNLGEAAQIMPEINIAQPNIIPHLISSEFLKGNDDIKHKRLKQFKILEEKQKAQKESSSNEEFLRNSNIKVSIMHDCENQKERILDLINRSNQLNYTKIRLNAEEFDNLLLDKNRKNCYITVKDNYGDYGIVGFASLIDNKAEHFLFSCRTIGMGVEQYTYAQLGFPDFEQVGEVINDVTKNYCPDWININKNTTSHKYEKQDISVLLRGGCDLEQMESYLHFKTLKPEFNCLDYHRSHTIYALDIFNKYPELQEIKEKVPFIWEHQFETELFDNKYDVIVMSVLIDFVQEVYQYKKNPNIKIAHGVHSHALNPNNTGNYSKEELQWFFDNFEPIGRITPDELMKNLKFIREHIDEKISLIIINGCEVPHENPKEPEQHISHIELNKVVDDFVSNSSNTYLLDVRKFVKNREQLTNNIRHYERTIYFSIANELSNIIEYATGYKIKLVKYYKLKKIIQTIFSIKISSNRTHLVITALGIKINIKIKN